MQQGILGLPLELLEEIAAFFPASKAAKVVTVNLAFHAAFTRRIWTNLDMLASKALKRIPASAWRTYGGLVRKTVVWSNGETPIPLECIQNVTRLSFSVTCIDMVFNGNHEWHNLQRVDIGAIEVGNLLTRHAIVINKWIAKALERGQFVKFEWRTIIDDGGDLMSICDFADMLTHAEHHLFNAEIDRVHRASLDMLHKFATMAVNLTIGVGALNTLITCSSDAEFKALCSLYLTDDSDNYYGVPSSFSQISQDRFPLLQYLAMTYPPKYRPALQSMFAQSMPSITRLELADCDDSHFFEHLLHRLPNAATLILEGHKTPVIVRLLSMCLPRLQRLEIHGAVELVIDDADSAAAARLPNLKELVFHNLADGIVALPGIEYLSLAVDCAPNLYELDVTEYRVTSELLAQLKGRVNASVRYISARQQQINDIGNLLAIFPGVKRLELSRYDDVDVGELAQMHPNVLILQ
ncbi:hypothetical protein GQ42DRAFT_87068 [Ramicandelaber brevisporus]|nr:hypothetical protein GQ42DRAFT_87068 [Ramicandelaber brevisporus]